MNLQAKLAARVAAGKPVRVGLVGAGKFGSMFLSQVPSIPGLEVAVISETSVERGQAACRNVGWDEARIARTKFSDRGRDACLDESVEVVVEATGRPDAGIAHAIRAIDAGKHIVMVNVEADCLAGWLLAAKARDKGVVYSMAYGDQPALVAEMVDWARSAGFHRRGGRKGHEISAGLSSGHARRCLAALRPDAGGSEGRGHESRRCSIRFSTARNPPSRWRRSANACLLDVPEDGLKFPPCGVDSLAHVLRPRAVGGELERDGMVEVISSLERDGRPVDRDLALGCVRGAQSAERLCRGVFQAIRSADGFNRPLCGDVQAVSFDRT